MDGQIVLIRLVDGTDIIGKQMSSTRKDIQLDNALEIIKAQVIGSNDPFLYFSKYSTYSKEFDVVIPRHQIISISEEPLDNLMKYYNWFLERIKKYWNKTAEEDFDMILKKLKYLDKVHEKDQEKELEAEFFEFPELPGKRQIH